MTCPFGQDPYFANVDAVIGFEDDVPMPGNRAVVFVCEALSDQRIMRKLFPVHRSVAEFQHVDRRDDGYLDCGTCRHPKSNRQTVINFTENRANVYGLVDRDRPNWTVDHSNLIATDYCDIEATLFHFGQTELISLMIEQACQIPPGFVTQHDLLATLDQFKKVAVSLQYCYRNFLLRSGDDTFRSLPHRLDHQDFHLSGNTTTNEYAKFFASLYGRTDWIESVPFADFSHTWINGHLQVYSFVYAMKHNIDLSDKFMAYNVYLPTHSRLTSIVENLLTNNEDYLRQSQMFRTAETKITKA